MARAIAPPRAMVLLLLWRTTALGLLVAAQVPLAALECRHAAARHKAKVRTKTRTTPGLPNPPAARLLRCDRAPQQLSACLTTGASSPRPLRPQRATRSHVRGRSNSVRIWRYEWPLLLSAQPALLSAQPALGTPFQMSAEVAWKRTRVRGWKPAPLSGALRAPPKHQKPASLPPGEGGGRTRRAGQGPPLPGPFHVCFSMKSKVSAAAAGPSARCHAGRPAGSSDVGEPRARPRLQGLGQMNILQGLGLGPMASVIGRTAKVVRI